MNVHAYWHTGIGTSHQKVIYVRLTRQTYRCHNDIVMEIKKNSSTKNPIRKVKRSGKRTKEYSLSRIDTTRKGREKPQKFMFRIIIEMQVNSFAFLAIDKDGKGDSKSISIKHTNCFEQRWYEPLRRSIFHRNRFVCANRDWLRRKVYLTISLFEICYLVNVLWKSENLWFTLCNLCANSIIFKRYFYGHTFVCSF